MNRVEYRCVLLRPHSRAVLAFADASGVHLPRVHIPPAARPAYELQRAIRNRWGLNIFVLDASPALDGFEGCAIAELLASPAALKFSDVLIEQLIPSELSEGEWGRLQLLLKERPEKPICHFGWVDEAVAWIESATGRRFSSKQSLKQANAGGGFALFRVRSDDGRHYWVKATAEPNAHEYRITEFLAELCPEHLPKLVATRKEWNAWLTEDAGRPISNPPGPAELDAAAAGMAQFQLRTIGLSDDLLNRGASDHRLPVLRSAIDSVIGYLIEAMSRQTSTKAIPINQVLPFGMPFLCVFCFVTVYFRQVIIAFAVRYEYRRHGGLSLVRLAAISETVIPFRFRCSSCALIWRCSSISNIPIPC